MGPRQGESEFDSLDANVSVWRIASDQMVGEEQGVRRCRTRESLSIVMSISVAITRFLFYVCRPEPCRFIPNVPALWCHGCREVFLDSRAQAHAAGRGTIAGDGNGSMDGSSAVLRDGRRN